ncbi:MAG: LptF/LptG family permease [Brevinema sp.]
MKTLLIKIKSLLKREKPANHYAKHPVVFFFLDIFYFFKDAVTDFIFFFHPEHFVENLRTYRWNKLDTYIVGQFTAALLGSILLFVSIYEMAQIFQDMRGLPDNVNQHYLSLHYWATVPYWTFILQPFGFLFATVFVLSKLAASREMVAMVSSGTSVFRLTFYLIFFSAIYYILIVTVLLNNFVLPTYQKSFVYRRVALNQAKIDDLEELKNNTDFTIFGAGGLLYLGSLYNAKERYIDKATVVQYSQNEDTAPFVPSDDNSEWLLTNRQMWESLKELRYVDSINFSLRIDADRLYWVEEAQAWAASNATLRSISEGGTRFEVTDVDYMLLTNVNDPYWFFERSWYPIDAMTVEEGLRHIYKLRQSGRPFYQDLTKYYAKDAYPLGIVFVIMVGIGLVNMASKTVSVPINSALSMAVFVVYYLMYTSFLGMAGRGDVSPIVGGYGGSLIFGVLAFLFYSRTVT